MVELPGHVVLSEGRTQLTKVVKCIEGVSSSTTQITYQWETAGAKF